MQDWIYQTCKKLMSVLRDFDTFCRIGGIELAKDREVRREMKCRVVNLKDKEYDVYIGRGSK